MALDLVAVIDTNVVVSALRSRFGASNDLIMRLANGEFIAAISNALVLEYEDVLYRPGMLPDYLPPEILCCGAGSLHLL